MPTFLLECQLLYDEQYRHIRHLVLVIVIITIVIINSPIFLIFAFIMAVTRAAGQHNTSEE